MFGFGVGPALVLMVLVGQVFFQIPIAVSAPIAALTLSVLVYAMTRERNAFRIGVCVFAVASAKFLLLPQTLQATHGNAPSILLAFAAFMAGDGIVVAISSLAMVLCAAIGIVGARLNSQRAALGGTGMQWLSSLAFWSVLACALYFHFSGRDTIAIFVGCVAVGILLIRFAPNSVFGRSKAAEIAQDAIERARRR